ncbi:MAG TPA: ABC transporter permease [Pyrinomonadaceae bacterium]|nr:ABC transporter permease [Pyrinomonadaceae bacterium]
MSSTSYDGSADPSQLAAPARDDLPDPRPTTYHLPPKPVITIRPSKPWAPLNLRSLWAYRELLFFLIWRDVKVRYKQTVLGATWAIIQPLTMMMIFTVFFSQLARIPTEGVPSGLFYYSGLSLWMFFSNAAMGGANSLIGNTNLITKIYFPRLIIPSAAVLACVIDFAIASLLLIPLLIYYNFSVSFRFLLLLPISAVITILALAMGVLFSALNTKYRDVRYALPFLLQVWMFVSPVIYPSSLVPREWRWLFSLNPLTGIISGYRAALFGQPIHWGALAYSMLFTLIFLSIAAYTFRRMERSFAEVI